MITYKSYIQSVYDALDSVRVTNRSKEIIDNEEALIQWCALTESVMHLNATLFIIGNGASAMMASHMAADAGKNGGFRTMTFNDVALMTAVSNDIGFEDCFSYPLNRFADSKDMLLSISSSGNSPNIIKALDTARYKQLKIITLSGMRPDNRSRQMGDLNFYVPANTYGIVESAHQVLLHCWLDCFTATKKS